MFENSADLVLALRHVASSQVGGLERACGIAELTYRPADREPALSSAYFPFTAPLGPVEKENLDWYLERYPSWPTTHAGHVSGLRFLPMADEEFDFLSQLARRLGAEDRGIRDVRREDLDHLLEQGGLHMIHVIAHGYHESDQPDEAAILMVDKQHYPSSDLIGPIATKISESRPLVFLNACLLGQQGYTLTRVGGWARAFVDAGCAAFIGPRWSVDDNLTFEFARTFYDCLVDGRTLGQSARAARRRVRELAPGSPAWLAPVVYAHPNGRLAPVSI